MHKNIYRKYKTIICFAIFVGISNVCVAGELEDAIAAIAGNASAQDASKGNADNIAKHVQELKPADSGGIDAQLAQIEKNYKAQIDASTLEKNHDPLKSDLSNIAPNSDETDIAKDIKEISNKNAEHRGKFKIADDDELLATAHDIASKTNIENGDIVTPARVEANHSKLKDRILSCREAADTIVAKCYRTLVVRAQQPEDIKFITRLYYAANSYAGHHTSADLKTGKITYDLADQVLGSSRIDNPFDIAAPNAQIISLRNIESRRWNEAGVHQHEVYEQITQHPSLDNGYVYKSNIEQGAMGKKKHQNANKYHGRVEAWEVVARPAPVLIESWDEGECGRLAEHAQNSFCEGPAINLLNLGETRVIPGYPRPVTHPHWQEEHTYTCGGGSYLNECESLRKNGCTQIESKCIQTKGPYCIEYLQTLNCGTKRISNNLNFDGARITIDNQPNMGGNDGFGTDEFANTVAQMSMVNELKKNILRDDNGNVLLFKGDRLTCDKDWGNDIKNCCNLKGIFKNIIGHRCPKEVEEILAPAVIRQKRCVEVNGWQCIAKTLGKCRKWRKSFCCYQSRLARIFQQIAHHQLGISWGSAESPNCDPLDPHTFGNLNFDEPFARNLLKELLDEATVNAQKYANSANAKLVNGSDLSGKVKALQNRVNAYYANKKTNKEVP